MVSMVTGSTTMGVGKSVGDCRVVLGLGLILGQLIGLE